MKVNPEYLSVCGLLFTAITFSFYNLIVKVALDDGLDEMIFTLYRQIGSLFLLSSILWIRQTTSKNPRFIKYPNRQQIFLFVTYGLGKIVYIYIQSSQN